MFDMEEKFIKSTQSLISFINSSPSCFHVVENIGNLLRKNGFTELSEKEEYHLELGKSYFVTRNGSSLIAFKIPTEIPLGYKIIASHTDSPCFKLKENPEAGSPFTVLNVETYGGMLMAPWFDRTLSVAGRAFVRENSSIVQKNVNLNKDLCSIPNLCIHQNRDINKGHEYKVQKELMPLISDTFKPNLLKSLTARELGVREKDIIDSELFLYNREEGKIWGDEDQFFSSPRIDDQMCVFASVTALLETQNHSFIDMAVLFDNEEVGSLTKQGADGDFLSKTVQRISDALGFGIQKQGTMQANSFMLSADNGHSLHPNYQEMCDITNKPMLNKGILIKFAGNQKYTTDAFSGAVLKNILSNANIPYQVFFNNSNVSGGSTLGNISQNQLSIPCVDIGAAQLAMHSPYETAGTKDTFYLTEGMKAFFNF